jgi:hypothetical protein
VGQLDGHADLLPRAQVGEAHDTGLIPAGHHTAVGAGGERVNRDGGEPERADHRRVLLQDREQVAAGGGAVLELDRGDSEQQGAVERRLAEGEHSDPLGVGGPRLRLGGRRRPPRVIALAQSEHAAGDRHAEQERGRQE